MKSAKGSVASHIDSEISPRGYAADALKRAKDNPEAAEKLLVQWAEDDDILYDILLQLGASQLIRSYYTRLRRSAISISEARIARGIAATTEAEREARASARIARRTFLERYTLYGHQTLGSAKKPDLIESVRLRRIQAHGNLTRATFEEAISLRLPNNTVMVRQQFSEEDLLPLAREHEVSGD